MASSASKEADGGGYVVDGSTGPDMQARLAAILASVIPFLLSNGCFNHEEGRERRKTNDKNQTLNRKRQSEDPRAEKDDGNKRARRTVDKNVKSAKGKAREIEEFKCKNCNSSFANEKALKTHKNICAGEAHIVDLPTSQTPSKRKGAASNLTPDKLNSKYDKGKTRFPCKQCKREYSTKSNLERHVKRTHLGKKPEEVVATKVVSNKNEKNTTKAVYLPTSQTPSKRKGAASNLTPDKLNSKYDKGKTRFPCKQCKREYSTKSNLARHVKPTYLGKKPEEVMATKVVSNKNKNEKNTTKAEPKREPKCEKSKCVFCDKEFSAIYRHYGNIHNIEYPEQLLFFNSNVLVISDIDTKGGKAPWFIREAEKAKRYTPTKCRLCVCETDFHDPALLENHYRSELELGHKVVPGALERLQHLFRAKEGAHLADLPASRAPSKQQKSTLRPPQGAPLSRGLLTDTNGYVSAAEHNNQKPDQEIEKQDDATTNTTLQNVQNYSRMTENSNSLAIHQAQDTEAELEGRDAFSQGQQQDLELSLQILLEDGENYTYVNASTSGNSYTSSQLRNILETKNDMNDTDVNISQDIFTSEPSELPQDMFSETTQSQEHVDIADDANETVSESDQGYDGYTQPNPRSSTRDIIRLLLEDTTSGFNADTEEERRTEEKRKIDQQRLIDETQRIRDIMFSRD